MGGAVDPMSEQPTDTMAPADQGAAPADPLMQIAELAMEGLETGNCDAMAAACEGILMLLQEGAPAEEAPAPAEPVFKKGGKIVRRK